VIQFDRPTAMAAADVARARRQSFMLRGGSGDGSEFVHATDSIRLNNIVQVI
jgi:hypothetical protein